MSNKTFTLPDELYAYLINHSLRESGLLARLRDETATLDMAAMQIAPEQGQFMGLLARLMQARRAIEIGTFTGYSSICLAEAMGPSGYLLACDTSEDWTAVARRYWNEAGLSERIDLRIAPALETLDAALEAGQGESYDLAFIDADKENYINYYERCLQLLRPGGLILVDNVLWSGRVADPDDDASSTVAIRAFNKHVHNDDRVELSLLPLADGLSLLRRC